MIKIFILLLSLGLSFVTVFFGFNVDLLPTIFLYVGFTLVYILSFIALFFILWGLAVFSVNKNKEHSYSKYYRFVMYLLDISGFSIFNIKVKFSGREIVDNLNSNFILICNHQSNLDSLVSDYYLRKHKLIFIGKKSLFKIPFVGKTISGLGYLSLDRDDFRQETQVIKKASEILNEGKVSIGIFPEGTRNKNKDNVIGELKSGSFHLATNSHKPIVLSLISYDKDITANVFKIRHCKYKIFKAISYDEYKDLTTKEISTLVHNLMQEEMNKLYVKK